MKGTVIKKAAAKIFLAAALLEATAYYYVNNPGTHAQNSLYWLLYYVQAITGVPELQNLFHYLLPAAKILLFTTAAIAIMPQAGDGKKGNVRIFLFGENRMRADTAAFFLALILVYDQLNLLQLAALAVLGSLVFLKGKMRAMPAVFLAALTLIMYLQNVNRVPIDFGPGQTIALAKNALKDPLMLYDGNGEGITYYTHPPLGYYIFSLFFLFFGVRDTVLVYATISIAVAIVLSTFYTGKKLHGGTTGIIAAYLLAFNPLFYFISASVHIDIVFALSYLVGIYLIYLADKKQSARFFAISGIATGITILTKEVGILMLISGIIYFLLRGKQKKGNLLIFTTVALAPVLLWVLQGTLDWGSFTDAMNFRISETLHQIDRPWYKGFFSTKFAGAVLDRAGWLFMGFVSLGIFRTYKERKSEDLLLITAAATLVFYFLFLSSAKETRYILPALPPLAIIGAKGAGWMLGSDRLAYKTPAMAALVLMAMPLIATLQPSIPLVHYADETKAIAFYIKENYGTQYLVVSDLGPAFNFYSGSKYQTLPIMPQYEEYFYTALEDNAQKSIVVLDGAKKEFEYMSSPEKFERYLKTHCRLQSSFTQKKVYAC